jgi:arylformamidase
MKSIIVGTMATTLLCLNACSQNTGVPESYKHLVDIQYRESKAPVNPQNAFDLDLYYSTVREAQRVIVFIHGGGWMRGDKSNIQKNPALVDFFLRKGYVVASINFRLPQRENPLAASYKDQAEDIATAIRWLSKNVQRYGGNPREFILFGYSSGAHLAALVATDERYLARQGLNIDVIKGAILMDVHTFDIPAAIASMRNTPIEGRIPMIEFLFGRSASEQVEASPASYTSNPGNVSFLIITAGVKDGDAQGVSEQNSEAFKSKLVKDGHLATHEHFGSKSHLSLVMEFGHDSDPVSRAVAKFLDGLKTTSLRPPSLMSRLAALLQRCGNSGGFHASAGEIISNSAA